MPDDGRPNYGRRVSDSDHGTRLTVLEIGLGNLEQRFDRHMKRTYDLIEKLDGRADRQDIMFARLLAGLAVLMVIGQIIAPPIVKILFGITSP